ncbi:unnamed protein product [Clonostachys rosea f. rosea IK726]|uniref:Uncharacterized protein n=3 Tax=Clonostachys TaxID=110564 RepID=A0A0B7KM08_BIOOC|nr:unnamed protein product [Clonostachys rosea f. rosea IK726]CAI6048525.1 unnamed protein product [Clonostachys chloroleuca]
MGKKERSKRKRTLIRKMIEYSLLFDVDIMIITRDKETKQQKLFRPTHRGVDAHWMPDLENIEIFDAGDESVAEDLRSEFEVRRMRRALQASKVPKLSDGAK